MHFKGVFEVSAVAAVVLLAFLEFSFPGSLVNCAEEYVYYGVVPSKIQYADAEDYQQWINWYLRPETVANYSLLSVVGLEDNTDVRIFTLVDGTWVFRTEFSLDLMDKHFEKLSNGTIFKVRAGKPVTVQLFGGKIGYVELDQSNRQGPLPATYYTSVAGNYVGKEFVFVASAWDYAPTPYKVLALENTEVKVTGEDSAEESFVLEANTYEKLSLKAFNAYKVESTGNIMVWSSGLGTYIGHWQDDPKSGFYVPSPSGGYVGRRFYSDSTIAWDPVQEYGLIVSALEDAKVTIWDLEHKRKVDDLEVTRGTRVAIKPRSEAVAIESDSPVTLSYLHNGSLLRVDSLPYSTSVTYMSVRPGEQTIFYTPTNCSLNIYFFACEDTRIVIDDVPVTIEADSYFLLTVPGPHRVLSERDVLILVIYWPSYPPFQGIISFGVLVPCIQTVNITPEVTLVPMGGEDFPTGYIIGGAAVAVVAAVLCFFTVRKKRTASPRTN